MERRIDFTNGKIVFPLLKFAGPVLLALFLQAMYGNDNNFRTKDWREKGR